MDPPDRTTGLSDIGRRIGRAYTLALCLVGLLSIGAFLALDGFIVRQGEAASIINVAGKQRMLSQRITVLSQWVVQADGADAVRRDRALLRAAIDDMATAHDSLMAGNVDRNLPGIRSAAERAHYARAPHDIDARVRAFLADARALLAGNGAGRQDVIAERMAEAARSALPSALDAVVGFHENRVRTQARRAEAVHLALLLVTIAILFIEARFVFAPLADELVGKEAAIRMKQAELVHASSHDQLTGLFNRHHLHAFGQSPPPGSTGATGYSLIALDIDNFKNVNDAHGHETGDRLLRTVAERIRANIRDADLAFRTDGDEFLVRIESDDPRTARDIAERLRADLQASLSIEPGCSAVGASIGIADAPEHGSSLDEVHANADITLYHAKSIGKNAVAVFHGALRTAFQRRRADEAFVREALQSRAFEPHFQPQVDMRTGRVVGVEALARCRNADGGTLSPGAFLPIAEATGLIVPLGEQVIDEAVRIARTWLVRGTPFGRLSVNASSAQLHDRGFTDFIHSTLARHDFPADRLAIEILETVMIDDDDTIVQVVAAIRAAGVSVELDDFGTGHTSIANVNRLRVDRIKIDRSFIAAIGTDGSGTPVLQAILVMARSLGVDVIAEGIETEWQRRQLIELGCPTGQGFLLARPMGGHDAQRWLDEAAVATAVPVAPGRRAA